MSCHLCYSVFFLKTFHEALDGKTEGVKTGGEIINNVRYNNDTAIIAEITKDL